jgi:hypothetical protein
MASYLDKAGLATLWEKIKLAPYPVGSIYMSIYSTSPASLFGGTWERLEDRFLLGASGDYEAGETGGETDHTLTVDEMPKHGHSVALAFGGADPMKGISYGNNFSRYATGIEADLNLGYTLLMETGKSQSHNNMPPYLVVYMWKRMA